jgi:arabinofuranan 3-O-arabinosyltransferase
MQSQLTTTPGDAPPANQRTRVTSVVVDRVTTGISELRQASLGAKVLWVVAAVVGVVDAYAYLRRGIFGLDFEPAWAAAQAILHGHTHWNAFVYLPGCLVFVFPVAVLPLRDARLIMFALQAVGLAYSFWAMTRMVKLSIGSARVAGLALAVALAGQVGVAANYENLTLLLLPFAVAFFVAVDRERFLVAAVVVGISITIKPLLIMLLVVLLVRRLWRETVVALVIPVVLTAVVFALTRRPAQFVHEVANTFASHNNVSPVNISLRGVLTYAHTPGLVEIAIRLVVALVSLGVALLVYRRPVESPGVQAIWLTTPLTVGLFLCFSFSWAYYAVLLLPLVFVVLQTREQASWLVLPGVAAALLFPVLVDTLPNYPSTYVSDWIASVGLLLVLGGVLLHARDTDLDVSQSDSETDDQRIMTPAASPSPS